MPQCLICSLLYALHRVIATHTPPCTLCNNRGVSCTFTYHTTCSRWPHHLLYATEELTKALRDRRQHVPAQIAGRAKAMLSCVHTRHSFVCYTSSHAFAYLSVCIHTHVRLHISSLPPMHMPMRPTISVYTAKAVRDGTQVVPTQTEVMSVCIACTPASTSVRLVVLSQYTSHVCN